MQSPKLGFLKGARRVNEGYTKGVTFCQKWYLKG